MDQAQAGSLKEDEVAEADVLDAGAGAGGEATIQALRAMVREARTQLASTQKQLEVAMIGGDEGGEALLTLEKKYSIACLTRLRSLLSKRPSVRAHAGAARGPSTVTRYKNTSAEVRPRFAAIPPLSPAGTLRALRRAWCPW
jgi:hypothetical protein